MPAIVALLVGCASTRAHHATLSSTTTPSSVEDQPPERPPLSAGRITGELGAGVVGGIVGATTGALVGFAIHRATIGDDDDGFSSNPSSAMGVLAGYPIGVAAGVAAVGSIGDETGSFSTTAAVCGGVVVAAMITAALAPGDGLERQRSTLGRTAMVSIFAMPLWATLAFNATRQYDAVESASAGSLLRVDGGALSIGAPLVIPVDGGASISLARGSF